MNWFWWLIAIYGAARFAGWLIDEVYGPPGLWISLAMAEEARKKAAGSATGAKDA